MKTTPIRAAIFTLITVLGAANGFATVINTTDGPITVTESVAPLGTAGTYISGGNGVIGLGENYPGGPNPAFFVPGATPASAASAYDHVWLQSIDGQGTPITWSLPSFSSTVFVIPGVDHPGIFEESLEFVLFGSNDGGATWTEGTIQSIYRDGFDTANTEVGHSDDLTSLWSFSSPVNMVRTMGGDHLDPHYNSNVDGRLEFEIDGVAVPEPATTTLAFSGLAIFGLIRYQRWSRHGSTTRR